MLCWKREAMQGGSVRWLAGDNYILNMNTQRSSTVDLEQVRGYTIDVECAKRSEENSTVQQRTSPLLDHTTAH